MKLYNRLTENLPFKDRPEILFGIVMGMALAVQEYLNILTGNFKPYATAVEMPAFVTMIFLYIGILMPVKILRDKSQHEFKLFEGLNKP